MSQFYSLPIKDYYSLTNDSVVITFSIVDEYKKLFTFTPGQYLTLRLNINGEEVRRSYSICSALQTSDSLSIGVKKVEKGLATSYLLNELKIGDTLEVMPPMGNFTLAKSVINTKEIMCFAAGSGITPILSIISSHLYSDEQLSISLIYGNKHEQSIMFKDELDVLLEKYPQRFKLRHQLSQVQENNKQPSKLGKWFKRKSTEKEENQRDLPNRYSGRINKDVIVNSLNTLENKSKTYFMLCGPNEMINSVEKVLLQNGVQAEQIGIEYFTPTINSNPDDHFITTTEDLSEISDVQLKALLEGESIELIIEKEKTILQALIDEGYNPPYSCESGICSTCVCKLKSGQVHMKNNLALSDDEVAKGYILSCQSLALTENVEIEYED